MNAREAKNSKEVEVIRTDLYTTILSRKLVEAKRGNFEIVKTTIQKGTILRAYNPSGFLYNDMFDEDFRCVRLLKDGGVLMSDTPMEQESLRVPVMLARGDILIIGLGIGLLPMLIRMYNHSVDSITFVESSPDVVQLVYGKIKSKKTSLEVCDGKFYLAHTSRKFNFIYIDVWGSIIAPMKGIAEWSELAKQCLTYGGEVRCWLQELYDRVKDKLPKEPVDAPGFPDVYDPCLICGKTLRNDYAGLCMDCADILGVSELYAKK